MIKTSKTIVLVARDAPNTEDKTAATIPSVEATAVTMPTATLTKHEVLEEKPQGIAETGDTEQGDHSARKSFRTPHRASGRMSRHRPSDITQASVDAGPISRLELVAETAATAKHTALPSPPTTAISKALPPAGPGFGRSG